MAGPVTKLMKRCPIVIGSTAEGRFRRKVDRIDMAVVVRAVVLIVTDPGAGMLKDALAGLNDLELFSTLWFMRRNSVNLLRVENGVHPVNHPTRLLRISWTVIRPCLRDPPAQLG